MGRRKPVWVYPTVISEHKHISGYVTHTLTPTEGGNICLCICCTWATNVNWGSTENNLLVSVSVCFVIIFLFWLTAKSRQKQLEWHVRFPTVLSVHTKVLSGSSAAPRCVSWLHQWNRPCSQISPLEVHTVGQQTGSLTLWQNRELFIVASPLRFSRLLIVQHETS